MSAAREIRDRIGSVRNTMKITNAMYMISSTKMNSARAALNRTEPYFFALEAMFSRLLRHLPDDFTDPYLDNRSKVQKEHVRRAIICVTADKGLAGAYNHNMVRLVESRMRKNDRIFVVGEVGRAHFEQEGIEISEAFRETAQKPTLGKARHIAATMLFLFRENKVDEVYIVYTEMKNAMESEPKIVQLLPLERLNERLFVSVPTGTRREAFEIYPDPVQLLDNIVPDYVSGYIYSALVESYCAEHSCRMQAMDAANKSGKKLLQELSIRYNRERQAAITQEITEVAAGARARNEQEEKRKKRKEA